MSAVVADYYDCSIEAITTLRRGKNSRFIPRQVAMYLSQKYCGHRLADIASYFGLATSSSVCHAVSRIEKEKEEDKGLEKDLRVLINLLVKK